MSKSTTTNTFGERGPTRVNPWPLKIKECIIINLVRIYGTWHMDQTSCNLAGGATLNRARVGAAGGAQTVYIGDTKKGFFGLLSSSSMQWSKVFFLVDDF